MSLVDKPVAIQEPNLHGGTELPLNLALHARQYPRTAQNLAYEVLRRSILSGVLAPNTRLTQIQIASQLSISTTPVREALRRLAGEALVRIDAHRGAIVQGLDKGELNEIYELRLLLEPLAARKAAEKIQAAELNQAEAICDRMDDHTDPETWAQLNRDFHAVFANAAGSPNLTRILEGLRDRAAFYVQWSIATNPEVSVRANQEHRQTLEAYRKHDGDMAASIGTDHLRATLQAVLSSDLPQMS